jgi:hypothetical protein
VVGVPRLPSALTGNRVRLFSCEIQRNLPSGEYVGFSCPTLPSEYFWLTNDAVPTVQISLYVDRSKICSVTDLSALVAARNRPSGLTEDPMNLPYGVTRRLPIGLMIWSLETCSPFVYVVPTWL